MEYKQRVLQSWYVKTMGICLSLEIASKNQTFLENLTSVAQFRQQFISRNDTHTAQEPAPLWCHTLMSLQLTHVRSLACKGRSGLRDWPFSAKFQKCGLVAS